MGQSFSTNTGLSALPEYDQGKDAALYAELLRIRNAFQVLQAAIDGLGGAGGIVVTHSGANFIQGQPIIAANNAGDTVSMSSTETSGFVMTAQGAGNVPIWASPALAAIADKRILSNISGASAAPIGNTLSALIDSILGSTQGQLITRNAGGWTVLGPSTGGLVLTEHGAGNNLTWAAPELGSAFSVYSSVTTVIPATTLTKLSFQTAEFDTNSFFNLGTSVFQPTIPGYYHLNWHLGIESGSPVYILAMLYKNGSRWKDGNFNSQPVIGGGGASMGSSIVFLNGSTDFLEVYGYAGAATTSSVVDQSRTYFNGSLIRAQ